MPNGNEDREPDVQVRNHGTLFTFAPLTARARAWVEANVQYEPYQYVGGALRVGNRYARDLAAGMLADGLHVV